ncbi:hypothetical protein JR316_0005605 [Psilocybe cubensis]|uniref:F-box domain-containing protein n=2 Tax=Psilocybe cubensis TaxID=181762 RepID=A0A8H8CLU8_PSICU|nr:hypothetical protein JR316_0005605 [Psilocybe cubensis]KAH9481086.1 hypothetical protein JR316_0005605 [Psilocybe cubensis]
MSRHLPQELNDEIMHYLWDDTLALKSCSLACRSFRKICQRFLFSSIVIYPPSYRKQWISTAFQDLLESSPHLAQYVRYLNVIDRHTAPKVSDEWLSRDTALVACLPQLLNLRGLVIQYQKYYYYNIPGVWSQMMRSGLVAAIYEVMHLPKFRFLDLTGFPLDLVKYCPNLRHLAVDDPILIKVNLGHIDNTTFQKIQLESLEVFAHEIYSLQIIPDADTFDYKYPEAFVKLCNESIDITQLKRLHASAEGCSQAGGHGLLAYIMHACAESLQELVFSPSNGISWGGEKTETIDWGAMTALRKLDVSFTWEGSDGGYDYTGPWPWFLSVCGQLFPPNVASTLEQFNLHIKYDVEDNDPSLGLGPIPDATFSGSSESPVGHSDDNWRVLLDILGDRKRLPRLYKVDIQLSAYGKDMSQRISTGLSQLIRNMPSVQPTLSVTVLEGMC